MILEKIFAAQWPWLWFRHRWGSPPGRSKTFATFCFLDATLTSLLYFNQRHAHFRRQCERPFSPAHRRAEAFHANYWLQCARGTGSLTNRKAGMQHPGHHPRARLVVFSSPAPLKVAFHPAFVSSKEAHFGIH